MTLLAIRNGHLAFGDHPLLDGVRLALAEGERIGLIGRNGTGKSSLLRILAGTARLDDGEFQVRPALRTVFVEQEPELPDAPTLRDSLEARRRAAFDATGRAIDEDDRERWARHTRLSAELQRFQLDGEVSKTGLSGGERKRAALALALAEDPELLLLDEPTNHLDIAAIEQLEERIAALRTVVVITHDRAFLDRVTTRIWELDRGVLRAYDGNYSYYEARRSEELSAEDVANRRFDKFWAQEEVWIRKGVEARRTRNEGRVKRLERLRDERAARRERVGDVAFAVDAGERSGRLVAELEHVSMRFGDRPVVDDLSMRIMRGDRIGIVGSNGSGKSTLLRLILGTLAPTSGRVRVGTNLNVAYFDQMREQLDPDRSVAETISPGSDWIEIGGERKHVTSYLADFLFPSQRARSPVGMLSGGERNRLLLARLFARPANLLVLDEPTNDLDIETLELLEQLLQEYPGTLLLVSHDRQFLDDVVTQTVAPDGDGRWREFVGGYSDWLRQRATVAPQASRRATAAVAMPAEVPAAPRERTRARMSWRAQRELESLPAEIERLEAEQSALVERMSSADYGRNDREALAADGRRTTELETVLAAKYARWEELEAERARSQ